MQIVSSNAMTTNKSKQSTGMKLGYTILFLLFLTSCTPIYLIINNQKVKDNDKQISDLSNLIMNDDYQSFLNKLTINNKNIYNAKDTLGFGYYLDVDHRCFNDEICFGTNTIRIKDSIISMTVYPSFFRIKPIIAGHYKRKFKKAGWKFERGYGYNFESKICGFKNSTIPITDTGFIYQPNSNVCFDSLMSPNVKTTKCFDRIKDNLTENELLYLLHSTNPRTRLIVVKHIKCKNIQTSKKTTEWMNYVIKTSPQFKTNLSRCMIADKPIEYFLYCK
jgi:hypothetical protein